MPVKLLPGCGNLINLLNFLESQLKLPIHQEQC